MEHEISSIFRISADKVTLISVKNNGHFTLRPMIVSRWILLRLRNVSDKRCREMFHNFFPENRAVYEVPWKNMAEPDRPQMTVRRMRVACRMTKAINTHSKLVIRIAFSSPKIVTRTRPDVTLYVYCLSCIDFARHFIILIQTQNP
jgi:hypothetical protein